MLGLQVSPASIQDRDMIAPLLSVVAKHVPSLVRAMADGGYQGEATTITLAHLIPPTSSGSSGTICALA